MSELPPTSTALAALARGAGVLLIVSGCAGAPGDPAAAVQASIEARGVLMVDGLQGRSFDAADAEALPAVSGEIDMRRARALALARNPHLHGRLAQLGIGEADRIRALRIRNPVLELGAMESDADGQDTQLMVGLVGSLSDVLSRGARGRLAELELEALRGEVAAEIMATLADAGAAQVRLVAALQRAALREREADAAATAAELGARFFAAGNLTERMLAQLQADAARAQMELHAARGDRYAARAELATLMGVSSGSDWRVPERLPSIPDDLPDVAGLVERGLASRLDLQAADVRVRQGFEALPLARRERWLGALELGVEYEREGDGEWLAGGSLGWTLPVFDDGSHRVLAAESRLRMALAGREALRLGIVNALQARQGELGEARARVRVHVDARAPATARVVARMQEQYDFMLSGVFELIEARRHQYLAGEEGIAAVRDYWLTRIALERALGEQLEQVEGIPFEALASTRVSQLTLPTRHLERAARPAAGDHAGHGAMQGGDPEDHSAHGNIGDHGGARDPAAASGAEQPGQDDHRHHQQHGHGRHGQHGDQR